MKYVDRSYLLLTYIVLAAVALNVYQAFGSQKRASINPVPQQASKAGINVLFLMTDQQHHMTLSATGNRTIETPNLDRLARQGAMFELATCPTPFCSPTRASLITGLWPHTHGVVQNYYHGRNNGLKENDFPNTETMLNKRGYATRHRGKWHLGPKNDFSCYENTPYAGHDYKKFLNQMLPAKKFADNPGNDKYVDLPVYMIPEVIKGQTCFHNRYPDSQHKRIAMIGRTAIPVDLLPEAHITNQVMELIQENAVRNWMITASWHPPHAMWVAPEPYYSMIERSKIKLPDNLNICPEWLQRGFAKQLGTCMGSEGIREYIGIYQAQVAMIDYYVGMVLNKLDELGLTERTLVIFTSDHGDMQGEHGMVGKSIPVFYEGVIRVPLLIRLPGKIKPGTVIGEPVSLVDLMPTILDYVGVPRPTGVQGASLRPLIEGRTKNWQKYSFSERRNLQGNDVMLMIRGDRYKYVFRENEKHELYDLLNDPHENENKFTDPASRKIILKLHNELKRWMKETRDPYLPKMPDIPFE
ncbi:MAG: sulfatase-like hydrolase/transferase [Planctomycetota bacterium]|nr:MAG: sulfatase-like hydrolase/transferase [Planctomycetota bacterium]